MGNRGAAGGEFPVKGCFTIFYTSPQREQGLTLLALRARFETVTARRKFS